MKISVGLLLLHVLINPAMAQNELQKCAEKKNKAIEDMVNQQRGSDSTALVNLNQLNHEWKNCLVGKKIPQLDVRTISGEKINTGNIKDKVVVMNFWFTTCAPCIAEIPAFNKLVKENKKKDVVFIGFAIDNKKTLKKFLRKTPFDFKIIPDAGAIEESFGVLEHPVTFVVDQSGKVRLTLVGASTEEKAKTGAYLKIKPVIDELLKSD